MPFVVSIKRLPQYARFNVGGQASQKNYFDLIELAAGETLKHGDTLALVDLRKVLGRLRFTDQFFIGELVAKTLPHLKRLAALVAGDPRSYNSGTVARRQGVELHTFASEPEAIAWLLGG